MKLRHRSGRGGDEDMPEIVAQRCGGPRPPDLTVTFVALRHGRARAPVQGTHSGQSRAALNPYKHAIFPHKSVNARLLVRYGIGAILQVIEHHFKEVRHMNNTLKVALSALALAALVAAPAVAKSRNQQTAPAQTYSDRNVYGEGHNLGTDPDPRVRSDILREGNPAYDGN
jgi:hypothetical protein